MRKLFSIIMLLFAANLYAQAATTCSSTVGGPACTGGLGSICVNLNWGASTTSGVTYSVYRGTTSGGENLTSPIASGLTGLTYQDNSVAVNTSYYYVTTAMLGGISSTASPEACAQTPNPPAPPTETTATPE